ncbi:zinc finger protein 511-like [Lolium rigidum]|uniref:zinc finger protein 511-like n=1 Tax=Lolium rigidum TaxID=89674 RepID=UPI001F5CF6AB|nr:zinc finger protein 511-like [Lolium rigidum]
MQQNPTEAIEMCAPGESGGAEAEVPKAVPWLGFWQASRRRLPPDDPFFSAGDMERELLAKHVALDLSDDDRYQLERMDVATVSTVCCPIAGCGVHLDCLEDFEDHYSTRHTASCSVCSRVYPTSRLLSIHISEAHDSFFQAKVARGFLMYECLVEGCGVKLKNYKSRQQHLVDKHQFPKSFEFFKRAQPSQRHRQKYHRRQTVHKEEEARDSLMDVDGNSPRQMKWKHRPKQHNHKEPKEHELQKEAEENKMEVEQKIDELTSAVSKLSTADSTPSSITFGHRRSRGLTFVPRSIRQNKQVSNPEAK